MLQLDGLDAGYGPVQVLRGVSFHAPAAQVTCVMGRNGAGKSTLMKAIMGLLPATAGRITLDGTALHGLPAHQVPRHGIAYVPQGRRLFGPLTVAENIEIGLMTRGFGSETRERVLTLFPRLRERLDQTAQTLSGGEQQMLAIGRALMTNPRLLILDEATEGLAPLVRAEIWHCLESLRSTGISVLVIDKNIGPLMRLADSHVILEKGRTVWQGSTDSLRANPAMLHETLGV